MGGAAPIFFRETLWGRGWELFYISHCAIKRSFIKQASKIVTAYTLQTSNNNNNTFIRLVLNYIHEREKKIYIYIYIYLTIIPRGRVGCEMIDSQRGA